MLKHNYLYIILCRFVSSYGIIFGFLCAAFVLISGFQHDQSVALVCVVAYFIFAFVLGWNAKAFGLSAIVFLLPLTPTLNYQITSIFPFLKLPVSLSGIRLISGFVIGALARQMITDRSIIASYKSPGIINFACLLVSCSVAIAISRNIWMSGSVFSVKGLFFNSTHFLINGWHDDYYPLTDLMAFGLGAVFISCVISTLKDEANASIKIINPILWSIIVAGIWAIIQNRSGLGLAMSSASGNRYYQLFGYASTGFQPDIHSFSAHMLLGAIGAWGCLFIKRDQISRWLIVAAILVGWIGLWMTKSRGSILLALLMYAFVGAVLLWKKNKLYFFITTTCILFGLSTTYLFHRWGMSIIPLWLLQYSETIPKLNINNLEALNTHFGNRAEIYHAGLRMFQAFPLMGIGQGEFYRMSGIQEFAKSKFLGQLGGENAHNYFLQTLVETGLIGATVLIAVLILPWIKTKERQSLIPAYAMIVSIGLGNLFAHALLVRENFFLLCALIGLIYLFVDAQKTINVDQKRFSLFRYTLVVLGVLVTMLSIIEVIRSFGKFPYQYGTKCFVSRELKQNEWTSGLMEVGIPEGSSALEIVLKDTQPNIHLKPLTIELSVLDQNSRVLEMETKSIHTTGPQTLKFTIQASESETYKPSKVVVKLSKCFVPRNIGMNSDARILGVLFSEIKFSR